MALEITFEKEYSKKKIVITSIFKYPLEIIWEAFTNPEITDKWWAPKPFKAKTKEIKFKNGGRWLYYMLSPEGEKFWSLADFSNIQPLKSYEVLDAFCDENGVINTTFPRVSWINTFSENNGITTVQNIISGDETGLRKLIEMGFEQGYKMGLTQLNELLQNK